MSDIDRENEQFNEGVQHVVELLAKTIGATDWVSGDGSEDYDEDLAQTLLNIVAAKGLYDPDTGRYAALSPLGGPTEGQVEAAAKAIFELDADNGPWGHAPESWKKTERGVARAAVTAALRSLPLQDHADDDDRMVKISKLIEDMQEVHRKFGDTCVYIRRGGLSWGAVALNRRDDDKKHGVFDLQVQHDRDMLARLEQVARLIKDRDEWRQKALGGPMVAEQQTEAKS